MLRVVRNFTQPIEACVSKGCAVCQCSGRVQQTAACCNKKCTKSKTQDQRIKHLVRRALLNNTIGSIKTKAITKGSTERHRHTYTQTRRHTDTETNTNTDTDADRDTDTDTYTQTQQTQAQARTRRHTDTQTV